MPAWLLQLLDTKTLVGFVLGGLATGAIAIWLQARVEHTRWLRQQRLEAFVAFLSALDSMHRPATRWQLSWETGDAVEMEGFFDQLEALDRIGGRIHLLSSTAVNRAAIDVLRAWSIEINSALKTHDADRMARALDGIPPLYRKFIELARVELGQRRAFLEQKDFDAFEGDRARLRDVADQERR